MKIKEIHVIGSKSNINKISEYKIREDSPLVLAMLSIWVESVYNLVNELEFNEGPSFDILREVLKQVDLPKELLASRLIKFLDKLDLDYNVIVSYKGGECEF